MAEETVTISKAEYEQLQKRNDFLECLEACGVDNWVGWDDSWEMYRAEED